MHYLVITVFGLDNQSRRSNLGSMGTWIASILTDPHSNSLTNYNKQRLLTYNKHITKHKYSPGQNNLLFTITDSIYFQINRKIRILRSYRPRRSNLCRICTRVLNLHSPPGKLQTKHRLLTWKKLINRTNKIFT
jgi:hypothetical protein